MIEPLQHCCSVLLIHVYISIVFVMFCSACCKIKVQNILCYCRINVKFQGISRNTNHGHCIMQQSRVYELFNDFFKIYIISNRKSRHSLFLSRVFPFSKNKSCIIPQQINHYKWGIYPLKQASY